jgi:hypothetical protein
MPVTLVASGTSVRGFQDPGYTAPTPTVIGFALVLPTVADNANSRYRGGISLCVPNFPFSPSNAQFRFISIWTRATYFDEPTTTRLAGQKIRFYWRESGLSWLLYLNS